MLPLHDLKALSDNYKKQIEEKKALENKRKRVEEDLDTLRFTKDYTKIFEDAVMKYTSWGETDAYFYLKSQDFDRNMNDAEMRAAVNLFNEIEKQGFTFTNIEIPGDEDEVPLFNVTNTKIQTIRTKPGHYKFEFYKDGYSIKHIYIYIDWSNIQPNEDYVAPNYKSPIKSLLNKVNKLKVLNAKADKIINE